LAQGERVWVGVDTHRKSYSVALWSQQREALVASWSQPASPSKLSARLQPWRQQVVKVVYEAGPTGFGLARHLQQAGFVVEVVAPSQTPVAPGPRAKSDRLDSCQLARWVAKGMLKPIYIPTPQQEADRQLVRLREQLVAKARKVKLQIKSFLLQHGISEPAGLAHWSMAAVESLKDIKLSHELRLSLDLLLEDLEHARGLVKKATGQVKTLAATRRHAAGVSLLESAPPVALITAMTYRTELLAPERFNNAREVTLMIGLAPNVRSSGQTRREGHLIPAGNRRLRSVLVEAAWRWIGCDERASEHYRRIVSNTGNAKKAIVAVARKLAIILWHMSVTGETYRAAA
jgi:transposase